MNLKLQGKIAIVCGASKGLGLACAQSLAEEGVSLILVSRSEDQLKKAILDLKNPELHTYIAADLSSKKEVEDLIKSLSTQEKRIDILINNAGGPSIGPSLEATQEQYLAALQTHLFAADNLVKYVVPKMKKNGFGRIVNIISVTAKIPLPMFSVSNTLRGAMLNWSKTLSLELAQYGINVNNVLPGYTRTQRMIDLITDTAKREQKTFEEVESKLTKSIPLGRLGEPNELASLVTYLASEKSSFINGASIPVDGGWTMST